MWNYDYRLDEVVRFLHEDNGNGWYLTRLGMFDGSRMSTRHPSSGEPAATAVAAGDR